MGLRNRITNFRHVATATPATVATLKTKEKRAVARVAIVAVADEENKENDPAPTNPQLGKTRQEHVEDLKHSADMPTMCTNCGRLEEVEIVGKPVPGCLYTAPGEYADGWKRLSVNLKKCLWN